MTSVDRPGPSSEGAPIADSVETEAALRRISGERDTLAATREPGLFEIACHVAREGGLTLTRPAGVATSLAAIAQASRCRARRVELVGPWWSDGGPPMVGSLEGRPVALVTDTTGRYAIVEAPGVPARPIDAAVGARLGHEAFQLIRPLPARAVALSELLRVATAGIAGELVRVALWGLAITAVATALPVATGMLIDEVIPNADLSTLLVTGGGLLALTLAGALFRRAQAIGLLRLDGMIAASAQLALWDRVLSLPLSFVRAYSVGELVARARSVSAVSRLLTGLTLQALLSGALGLLNLGVLVYYSPPLAGVALAAGLVVVALTVGPASSAGAASRALVTERGSVFAATVQVLGGVAKIQAAGVQAAAQRWWWQGYARQLEQQWRVGVARSRITVVGAILPLATSGALYFFAARLPPGALSGGQFIAFHATFALFLGSLAALTSAVVDVAAARAEAERARPLLTAIPEVHPGATDPGELAGGVELDKVRFRYRPDAPHVVDGVSLAIRPGEVVALVGASGCGKSTLLRLLLGFERPESGQISFDGKDVSGLDFEAVRRQLGVVLQTGRLSAGSILEAVAGASLVTVDEVWQALDAAAMRVEVEAMPMGIHTMVGEGGGNLSGGQRQRLLIARALVRKPKILVLDEATSALDNRAQATVSASLARLRVTRILVAHRLSTIRSADRVCVLVAGRVAQLGSYAELASVEGPFRQLIARQQIEPASRLEAERRSSSQ